MSIRVTVTVVLPDWCGADEAYDEGGESAVLELIREDIPAYVFDESATWVVEQLVTPLLTPEEAEKSKHARAAMTPRQIELARHALGLPNQTKKSYRNHFAADDGHPDYAEWTEMCAQGDARRWEKPEHLGGMDLFRLTTAGAEKALKGRESLDGYDFKWEAKSAASVTVGNGSEE